MDKALIYLGFKEEDKVKTSSLRRLDEVREPEEIIEETDDISNMT